MENKKSISMKSILKWCQNNINLVILILMIIVGAVMSDAFLSMSNLTNLFRRVAINGIMAIGFTMTLLIGGFDLSIGSTLSMGAVFAIGISNTTGSYVAGIAVALLSGILMGFLNGCMMRLTRGGSGEAFLITMATSFIGTAIALTYCKGLDLYAKNPPQWYRNIGMGELLGFPVAALIWIILMVVFQVIIKKTKLCFLDDYLENHHQDNPYQRCNRKSKQFAHADVSVPLGRILRIQIKSLAISKGNCCSNERSRHSNEKSFSASSTCEPHHASIKKPHQDSR